jgi:sugar phosphate isomerase/epimerase
MSAQLFLSAYAFGYGAGFQRDPRPAAAPWQQVGLEQVTALASEHGLAGVEVPLDRYFPDPTDGALSAFIEGLRPRGLTLLAALETFSAEYVLALAPVLSGHGLRLLRAKVGTFFGGNRHLEARYPGELTGFTAALDRCVDALDRAGVRVCVENHQDVTLADLGALVERFGGARVGITWDMPNSLPTGETCASFLRKAAPHIGHVHLKDYRLSRTPHGYQMHRCPLGLGVVPFADLLGPMADQRADLRTFTIELGAWTARHARIEDPGYWACTPDVGPEEIEALKAFVYGHAEPEAEVLSAFQRGAPPEEVAAQEWADVVASIHFGRGLLGMRGPLERDA